MNIENILILLGILFVVYRLFVIKRNFFKDLAAAPDTSTCESPIEIRMYHALLKAGLHPIPQYRIGRYRLDFAVFAADKKINIECDGKAFHSSLRQRARDRKRDKFMRDHGWIVMRFTGSQINRGAGSCARKVKSAIGYCN